MTTYQGSLSGDDGSTLDVTATVRGGTPPTPPADVSVSLSGSPASPQQTGTTVTLSASVSPIAAAGTFVLTSGTSTTPLQTLPTSSGAANFTVTLPSTATSTDYFVTFNADNPAAYKSGVSAGPVTYVTTVPTTVTVPDTIVINGVSHAVNGINRERGTDELILYTNPEMGTVTQTNRWGTEEATVSTVSGGTTTPVAIVDRTSTIAVTASGTTVSAALPGDGTATDTYLAHVAATCTPAQLSITSGWSAVAGPTDNGAGQSLAVYKKKGATTAPVATSTAAAGRMSMIITAHGPLDPTTDIDVTGTVATSGTASGTVTAGSVNVSAGATLLSVGMGDTSTKTMVTPSGMTSLKATTGADGGRALAVARQSFASAGASGSKTWTLSPTGSLYMAAVNIALKASVTTSGGGVVTTTVASRTDRQALAQDTGIAIPPKPDYVVSGHGTSRDWLNTNAAPGSSVVVKAAGTVLTGWPGGTPGGGGGGGTTTTQITKLAVIIEENHTLGEMQAGMPNLAALAAQYGYTTNFKAITHPSLPNYFALAAGTTFGVTDDANPPTHNTSSQSIFGQAIAAGKTAKTYAESMPSNNYPSDSLPYTAHHNPWVYFTAEATSANTFNVPSGTVASGNLRTDVLANALPNVSLIVPNKDNDAHDGSLATADTWLKNWLDLMMASTDFTSGKLAIVITADEDDSSGDNTVLTVVLHASLNGAHKVVTSPLTLYSITRAAAEVTGTTPLQNGASAASLLAAFGLSGPAVPGVPTNLQASAGNAQVSLSWSTVNGATGYNVYRGVAPTQTKLNATPLTTPSYVDTGLTNGTSYSYAVTAVNSVGESGKTASASATPTSSTSAGLYFLGASGEGAASGKLNTWMTNHALRMGGSWSDQQTDTTGDMSMITGEWGQWTQPLDFAVGGLRNGQDWASAAAGAYNSQWQTRFNNLKAAWGSRPTNLLWVRIAHEFNGNFSDYFANDANAANFVQAWRRWATILRNTIPGAHPVWSPNDGGNVTNIDAFFPGNDLVDAIAVDKYNGWPHLTTTAEFQAHVNDKDSNGNPVGAEAWRQYALSKGLPMYFGEIGNPSNSADAGGGGDAPQWFTFIDGWCKANAANSDVLTNPKGSPGKVFGAVWFNVSGYNAGYRFYRSATDDADPTQPNFAAAFRAATIQGTGPTPPPPPPPPTGNTYPSKEIAVYKMMWSTNGPDLSSINAKVNVVRLAFATGSGPSLVGFSSEGQTKLKSDIITFRSRGGRVVLSLGGGGQSLDPSNTSAFVNGISSIRDQLGALDGVDWDWESGWSDGQVHAVNMALAAKFGTDFAITFAQNGGNVGSYIPTIVKAQQAGILTSAGQQFYDAPVSYSAALGRVDELISNGIPASKISIGMMIAADSNHWTNAQCKDYATRFKADRGITRFYLWEASRSGTDQWATDMAGILGL
jgi:hypothetical protein